MKIWTIAAAVLAALAVGCGDSGADAQGGTDVGVSDAGAQDAGPGDIAAVDADPGDAGTLDGGPGDIGALDGGPGDIGASDGGPGDIGALDGGPSDAGAQDGGPGDIGALDAGTGDTSDECEGSTPLCAPSCGGDSFFGEATCEGGKWVCEEGIPTSDCPPGSCFGEKYPGEICTDQGWACAPDADAFTQCHSVMCLTCAGWSDPPTPTNGCTCTCQGDHVLCHKEGEQTCAPTSESTLADIAITVGATDCTFTLAEAAAGISVPYTITIIKPIEGAIAMSQDAGYCDQPGPSGLIPFEQLVGGDQSYCLCDSGLCQGPDETPVTLAAGSWDRSFEWDGRNWFGESDFGNPKGDPFPPGDYTLTISAKGKVVTVDSMTPFEAKATVVIHLVP